MVENEAHTLISSVEWLLCCSCNNSILLYFIYYKTQQEPVDTWVPGMFLNSRLRVFFVNTFDWETREVSPLLSLKSGFHHKLIIQKDTNIDLCKSLFERFPKIESHCLFFGNHSHFCYHNAPKSMNSTATLMYLF